MNADHAARWWQETESLRNERLRRAQEDAERCLERLHVEYFEPYDRLLERKAEYALRVEQEKGEIPARLLQEIEIMEKFRAYVERLEHLHEDQAFAWFVVLNREIQQLQRRLTDLNELAWRMMENEKWLGEQFLGALEQIKNLKNGTGTVSPRQD